MTYVLAMFIGAMWFTLSRAFCAIRGGGTVYDGGLFTLLMLGCIGGTLLIGRLARG